MLCLEGGYDTHQTCQSVEECVQSLLQPSEPVDAAPLLIVNEEDIAEDLKLLVSEAKQIHGTRWEFSAPN
jgi:hypothetical protein